MPKGSNKSPANTAELLRSALGLHRQGRLSEAQAAYERLLHIDPGHADALHLLGVIASQRGQFENAVSLIDRAIRSNPANAVFYSNRGNALQGLNKLEPAIADYAKAISIKPDFADAYYNRGNTQRKLSKPEAAIADYGKAISIKPDYAEAYNNRGNARRDLKEFEAAVADYGKAIAVKPDFAEAYNNRGAALRELKQLTAAIADYAKAISIKRDYAEAYNNRGNARRDLKEFEAAVADYGKAISIKPGYAEAYCNRGNALRDLTKLDAAIADYDKAISINPDYTQAYWNKANLSLLKGDLETGFELFEWRWKHHGLTAAARRFARPLWLGKEPLQDKKILLHSEQGLGDSIQFCRYALPLARAGTQVLLRVQQPLVALLRSLEGVSHVSAEEDGLPDFDYHCPLMSLPLAFKTDLGTIPDPTPYLHAEPAKVRHWQARIGERARMKVGVVWSGGFRPHQPELWAVNERRNISLALLARALSGVDVDWFSLQKGEPAESEIRDRDLKYWPNGNFHNFSADLKDFSDTAAFVANLDLVVSVDTSTAHVAAALGKPTWILNRLDTDWRWLLDRNDSPWYRSVKLYRQDESQTWEPVLRRVAANLTKLANAHRLGG